MSQQSLHADVKKILSLLDQVENESDSIERANLYRELAWSYHALAMYSRAIEMYKKSLGAHDDREGSRQVRDKLAELLIFLYGKDGFDEARGLARDCPPLAWWVDKAIKRKQAAIARREQKAIYNRNFPALKVIVGESQNILEACQKITDYAQSHAPVLITGDSGTGKEVVARALAEVSKRKFIPFNCGAVTEGVIESELFGHVKGAFTGATTNRPGLFETEENALIFLDEIGDASPKMQVDLLRVIQDREFYRVGDTHKLYKLKGLTKIVCATAKDLTTERAARRFRDDLFHRLSGLTIHCEPLAVRPEDVQLLVRHFLATEPDLQEHGPFSESDIDHGLQVIRLNVMATKNGPRKTETLSLGGNIRELQELVRKAVLERKFPKEGERPFQDRWGATTYTTEEVERCDWEFALKVCQRQKDAGRLMGKNPKDTSKVLTRLGLSKKQRKKQAPQVEGEAFVHLPR